MASVTIVEGSLPGGIADVLREAGHGVRAATGSWDLPGRDAPDVVILADDDASASVVLAIRAAVPGVRILTARAGTRSPGLPESADLALPADADPTVWAMALAALDRARDIPDPVLEEARASLHTIVQVARRAFDALGAEAAEGSRLPGAALKQIQLRLERSFELMLKVTLDRLERRLEGFGGRSGRVATLSSSIAAELGAGREAASNAEAAGRFHDLGMHFVLSPAALSRRGPLRPAEREAVHRHPLASIDALEPLHLPDGTVEAIRDHHERLDGSGYPGRAMADSVGMPARIVAVADSFEALTHPRPYRIPHSEADALDALEVEARAGRLDRDACGALRSLLGLRRTGR